MNLAIKQKTAVERNVFQQSGWFLIIHSRGWLFSKEQNPAPQNCLCIIYQVCVTIVHVTIGYVTIVYVTIVYITLVYVTIVYMTIVHVTSYISKIYVTILYTTIV